MRVLYAARILKSGGLLAHQTGTIAGVAALPGSIEAIRRMQNFKQRRGPFLLLADSQSTALSLCRYFTPELRMKASELWPGPFTLLFQARGGLSGACCKSGLLAVRVDKDIQTRKLARACGGLLLSSSLNRKGGEAASPGLRIRMRWHRHLQGYLAGGAGVGQASRLLFFRGRKMRWIR